MKVMLLTISRKLFVALSIFILFMTLLTGVLFRAFMPSFVESAKKNDMKTLGQAIINEKDIDRLIEILPVYTEGTDMSIYITAGGNQVVYGSDIWTRGRGNAGGNGFGKMLQDKVSISEDFYMTQHHTLQTPFLMYSLHLTGVYEAYIVRPYQSIDDVVKVSNQFFMAVGVLFIAVGMVFSYVYSKRFSRPIVELNKIAKSMARLDFTKVYTGSQNDEIGELGRNVNYLSKQLDQALTALKEELSKKEALQDMQKQFLAEASHELKTPLAVVLANIDQIASNYESGTYEDNRIQIIVKEIEHMDQIIKDLLKLSQLENPEIQLTREAVDLASIFDDVLFSFSSIINEKKLEIEYDLPASIPYNCDASNMETAIRNIVGNAIHHTENGKKLRIYAQNFEEDEWNYCQIEVFNQTNPLTEAELESVWKRFYKKTGQNNSSGLGLSIVKRILDLHGITFGLKNVDKGLVFYMKIRCL